MDKNILLYGGMGVCLILILASLSPVVGHQCVESDVEENKENYDEKDIFNSKKYLFETIIEIANKSRKRSQRPCEFRTTLSDCFVL